MDSLRTRPKNIPIKGSWGIADTHHSSQKYLGEQSCSEY